MSILAKKSLLSDRVVILMFGVFYIAGQWIPRPETVLGCVGLGFVLMVVGYFMLGFVAGISNTLAAKGDDK